MASFNTASAVKYLRPSISNIQVVQRDILDDLLLLVYITFGQRHVLLCLQVKLCGKSITATLSLQGERQGAAQRTKLKLNVAAVSPRSTK